MAKFIKVLITGGRTFDDHELVYKVLDDIKKYHEAEGNKICIIEGGAEGADRYAKWWAISRQVCYAVVPAHWDSLKKGAGAIRNAWSVECFEPHFVIAFKGNNGTADQIKKALKANIDVFQIEKVENGYVTTRPQKQD